MMFRTDSDGGPSRSVRIARAVASLRSDVPLAAMDAVIVFGSYLTVLFMRFDGAVPEGYWQGFARYIPLAVVVHLACNWMWGLYGQMWLHASVQEARRVVLAGGVAVLVLALIVMPGVRDVPASVLFLGAGLATGVIGGLRFQSRLFAFRRTQCSGPSTRLVIVGAGESGGAILREVLRGPAHELVPVAILDDDPRKQGRSISGVPVLGGVDDLVDVVRRVRADQVLMAIPSADGEFVRRVANAADEAGITLKVLPSVSELVGGEVSVRDVRDLSIGDLLGRQQIATDLTAVRSLLTGRRVLITGAGGSIGSEIARQVAACDPDVLLLLDHDETHLHDAAATLRGEGVQLLADIRDRELLAALFAEHQPEVVFHAAAHKHVPLLESHPCEAVATNVLGTANVVDVAREHGVRRLVFVSTDKAVRPSSVMGASKCLGEQIVLAGAPEGGSYCAVRFGNVLGSRGSVIPTFMRQIREGGPVTVTDARMTRYFMSIPEAVQLVLQAAAFSGGGEVFMLEMGEPVRIVDLAERMIRLSGRRVGVDVSVEITGIRPGEKLEEELRTPEETPHDTAHPFIVALYPPVLERGNLNAALQHFALLARRRDGAAAAAALFHLAIEAPRVVDLKAAQGDPVPADEAWDRAPI